MAAPVPVEIARASGTISSASASGDGLVKVPVTTSVDVEEGRMIFVQFSAGNLNTAQAVIDSAGNVYDALSAGAVSGAVGAAAVINAAALASGGTITVAWAEITPARTAPYDVIIWKVDRILDFLTGHAGQQQGGTATSPGPSFDTPIATPDTLPAHQRLFLMGCLWWGQGFTSNMHGDTVSTTSPAGFSSLVNHLDGNSSAQDGVGFYVEYGLVAAYKGVTYTTPTPYEFNCHVTPSDPFDTRGWVTRVFPFNYAENDGVDLAETANGFLFRTYADEQGAVSVERSKTSGATWESAVIVGIDGDYLSDYPSAPALAVDRWDNVHCWYHNAIGDATGYYSPDYGQTWLLLATIAAHQYPRPAIGDDFYGVACFSGGGQLTLHYSQDAGGSFTPSGIIFGDPPLSGDPTLQRPTLRTDRHGIWHLVYRTLAGDIVHRWALDPTLLDNWSANTTLAFAGDRAGYALADTFGFLIYFAGRTLTAYTLPPDGDGVADNCTAPAGTWSRWCWPGVLVSRREQWYWFSRTTALALRYSRDNGANWNTPS